VLAALPLSMGSSVDLGHVIGMDSIFSPGQSVGIGFSAAADPMGNRRSPGKMFCATNVPGG